MLCISAGEIIKGPKPAWWIFMMTFKKTKTEPLTCPLIM